MVILEFSEILNLPNTEIIEKISQHKNQLCLLRFKKITRQDFKPSDLKKIKNQIAKLKTVLISRINDKSLNEILGQNV